MKEKGLFIMMLLSMSFFLTAKNQAAAETTERVNVKSNGTPATGGSSVNPAVSGNGRFVVFESDATNLVDNDTNGVQDIFIHDRDLNGNGVFDKAGDIATIRVSVKSDGTAAAGGSSANAAVSDDGRFVAFESTATNLVDNDTNGLRDIFVHDRDASTDGAFDETGDIATIRVNVKSDGTAAAGGSSANAAVSDDGRFVVFASNATNLVDNDTNGRQDIFVHDRDASNDGTFDETGDIATIRVNIKSDGTAAAGGSSDNPGISGDGRFVVFASNATNLVDNDTNGRQDIFIYDRDVNGNGIFDEPGDFSIERVNVKSDSSPADGGDSDHPRVSDDGRFVVFESNATNLVDNDTNGVQDIFVHDRDASNDSAFDEPGDIATIRVNVKSDGTPAAGSGSDNPAISPNGRYVVFQSTASNIVDGDTNGVKDIFIHDRDTDGDSIFDESGHIITERVNLTSNGTPAAGGNSIDPGVSDDGRFVVFQSTASNLVDDDTNGVQDILVRDRTSTSSSSPGTGGSSGGGGGGCFIGTLFERLGW